jgi:hypothetical protein
MRQYDELAAYREGVESVWRPWGTVSAAQSCAQGSVYVGVIAFEHAELKFVGSGARVAGVDAGAFNEMITPDAGEEKRPRDGAADAAGLVFDCEIAGVL